LAVEECSQEDEEAEGERGYLTRIKEEGRGERIQLLHDLLQSLALNIIILGAPEDFERVGLGVAPGDAKWGARRPQYGNWTYRSNDRSKPCGWLDYQDQWDGGGKGKASMCLEARATREWWSTPLVPTGTMQSAGVGFQRGGEVVEGYPEDASLCPRVV
jgi:hypothetical protein